MRLSIPCFPVFVLKRGNVSLEKACALRHDRLADFLPLTGTGQPKNAL